MLLVALAWSGPRPPTGPSRTRRRRGVADSTDDLGSDKRDERVIEVRHKRHELLRSDDDIRVDECDVRSGHVGQASVACSGRAKVDVEPQDARARTSSYFSHHVRVLRGIVDHDDRKTLERGCG